MNDKDAIGNNLEKIRELLDIKYPFNNDELLMNLNGVSEKTDYTLEELGAILNTMCATYKDITTAIHLFGIKYGKCIKMNKYTGPELAKAGAIKPSYHVEISKGVRIYDAIANNSFGLSFDGVKTKSQEASCLITGYNKIYYGIPGSGKSYYVENEVLKDIDKNNDVFRTTFYLDYSNSDFVGQIMPVVNGKDVTYEYIPGPFTKALERALTHKDRNVYLVIEELNRGNPAAIFGDLFQLLDRVKKNDPQNRIEGQSEYPITNSFIESYFDKSNKAIEEGIMNDRNEGNLIDFKKGQIIIPSNLIIIATMNTSDQNVFPLDTAFKRRWQSELVKPNWAKYKDADNLMIPFYDISWKEFAEIINNAMLEQSKNGVIMEDKQLGPWFADSEMLVSKEDNVKAIELLSSEESSRKPEDKELIEHNKDIAKKFVYKIMDYLWSDVSKYCKDEWFEDDCKSLSHIIDEIDELSSDATKKGKYLCLKVLNNEK